MTEPITRTDTPATERTVTERIEDAVTSVNPDVWLASALVVVVIRCLGGLV
ncbi:MAG TPA: hypothetical protein VEB20_24655 [Azospirillaceae bacterium]|nr:hypothetical protein [Azospirillaceae bacterium]